MIKRGQRVKLDEHYEFYKERTSIKNRQGVVKEVTDDFVFVKYAGNLGSRIYTKKELKKI